MAIFPALLGVVPEAEHGYIYVHTAAKTVKAAISTELVQVTRLFLALG